MRKDCLKRLWEIALPKEELIIAVKKHGLEEVSKQLKVSQKQLEFDVAMLWFKYDTEAFAAQHLKIVDKHSNLIPLVYRKGQQTINLAIEKQRLEKKPVRICLLKARQFGGSTLFEAELFKECVLRKNRSSMIIAHDLDSAKHLRDMSKRYYDNYPGYLPKLIGGNDKLWRFQHREGKL